MSQILVIDDDKSIVDVMQLLLERDGHKVFGATDVGEAATALERFAVDIVITDVHMSNMEGIHFTMGLRHRAPQIKIVVMSGSTRHDLRERARHLGAVQILGKPFTTKELRTAIAAASAARYQEVRSSEHEAHFPRP